MTKPLRTTCLVIFGVCVSVANGAPPADRGVEAGEAKKEMSSPSASRLGFSFEAPSQKVESPAVGSSVRDSLGPVVVLPAMRVTANRVALSETEVLTAEGRIQFAKQKYTTPLYRATFGPLSQVAAYYFNFLNILNGWHPSEAEAMTLYLEDDRIRILSEADNLNWLESIDNKRELLELNRKHFQIRSMGIKSLYWDPFH